MIIENSIGSVAPGVPEIIKDKITFVANFALNNNEVKILGLAIRAVTNQLMCENVNIDKLTMVNIVFTDNGRLSLREENLQAFGSHVSFIIYSIGKLRKVQNERFMLFAFVEELVHHFWRIEDETKTKYKVLEIVQKIDSGITLELVKGWGLNGL